VQGARSRQEQSSHRLPTRPFGLIPNYQSSVFTVSHTRARSQGARTSTWKGTWWPATSSAAARATSSVAVRATSSRVPSRTKLKLDTAYYFAFFTQAATAAGKGTKLGVARGGDGGGAARADWSRPARLAAVVARQPGTPAASGRWIWKRARRAAVDDGEGIKRCWARVVPARVHRW